MPSSSLLTSPAFGRLVRSLKQHQATVTVVESCCGGVINASIMAQPGASAVYWGGSVAYRTQKAKPFLLNDAALHQKLTTTTPFLPTEKNGTNTSVESDKDRYIASKMDWTRHTALAFCDQAGTDFCIAEGGAAGPTFRPAGLTTGFVVVAVAARMPDNSVEVVRQKVIESNTNDREFNMRLFADEAAKLAHEAVVHVRGAADEPEDQVVAEEGGSAPPFETPQFDRATQLRSDTDALASMAATANYVVLHRNLSLFKVADTSVGDGHSRALAFLSEDQIDAVCATISGLRKETTFLGLLDGQQPVFGVDFLMEGDVKTSADVLHQAISDVLSDGDADSTVLEDTRTVAPLLSPATADNELVLHATALAQWQRRAPFCPACGGQTTLLDGGTSRKCTKCSQQSWPRQDPSMIAVVSSRCGQRVLLGRSPRHPELMFTALAGFVEAGETMEKAVAREVYEETGVRIDLDSVQYVKSQPWPFPQSCMIGFLATADETQELNVDTNELVAAQWFDKAQVQAATGVPGPVMQPAVAAAAIKANPSLELLIPPKGVLARTLLDAWLNK
jgi:NADH pyrophosphatase NudC (nudix superfamily)/nicotinamide mononucleotide (NMN) deamidase PncC